MRLSTSRSASSLRMRSMKLDSSMRRNDSALSLHYSLVVEQFLLGTQLHASERVHHRGAALDQLELLRAARRARDVQRAGGRLDRALVQHQLHLAAAVELDLQLAGPLAQPVARAV